jgi:hypothetical protein
MTFLAYCAVCDKNVAAFPLLRDRELERALHTDEDVHVMHATDDGEHTWRLSIQEKQHLREAVGGAARAASA